MRKLHKIVLDTVYVNDLLTYMHINANLSMNTNVVTYVFRKISIKYYHIRYTIYDRITKIIM